MIAPDDTIEEVGLRLAEWAALEAAAAGTPVPAEMRPEMIAMGVIFADGTITPRGTWALAAGDETGDETADDEQDDDVREPDDYIADCEVREPWSYDDLRAMRGAS